jgi:hypothetical protein
MVTRFGLGPWLGMLVGVVLSIGAGFIIGFLSNRLKGPYFALSTIAFSQVLLIGVSRWRGFTSGGEGIPVPFRPGFATLGLGHVGWVYMALAMALVCFAVQVYLERSRVGYQLAGVREDEDAAEALGIATRRLEGRRDHLECRADVDRRVAVGSVRRLRRSDVRVSRSISRYASRSTRSSAAWARHSGRSSARSSSPRSRPICAPRSPA